ncbi:hypothetical protein BH10CYA1_BH10CYA1_47250 [soil metagenome]
MNQERTTTADSPETDHSANAAAHFAIAMRNFNGLLRTNSLGQALTWARQSSLLANASNDDTLKATAQEAYVALVLVGAAKFEALTLHCGNITDTHSTLAGIIAESTDCLVEGYRERKAIPLMVALSMQGFTKILRQRVTAVANGELPTSTPSIEEIFLYLDQINQHAAGLTRSFELYEMTAEEKIFASADAISNSSYELSWLLPSDWAKALFYARRASALLTYGPTPDRPGMPLSAPTKALAPLLQPILDALPALIQKLSAKEYRESKRRIKELNGMFEKLVLRR